MKTKTIKDIKNKPYNKIKKENGYTIYYLNNENVNGSCNISLQNANDGKHLYYIFENVNFINGLFLSTGENAHVIFKNCKFHKSINIHSLGEVVFENNLYYADEKYPVLPKAFFTCSSHNLKFTNDSFENAIFKPVCKRNVFGIDIKTKFLMIEDSFFELTDHNGSINIKAFETIIFNSTINSTTININSDNIYTVFSSITASNEIDITNKNISEVEGFESPTLIYNGESIGGKRISLQ